ncbi:ATP-binding cassette domain-containing protein [Pedobacter sp. BS3]|uniref:ABC transporter ATP-binding protein n=1 Tax=Pedobacter sp. BS3 TaxID=2567937 RepID=UPI0011F00051|nr:ATP-binding cassette domain-containing protein [Pedobacter sp. BS3]TZF84683.1 ATP-binding cassette domain-containing protein [Pedobacter sp. BS3]
MISFRQVEKIFNKGKPNEVVALKPLDLTVADGDFLVVVGSNGSGKSTLLNLVSGSILATKGTIYMDDVNVTRMPDYKRSRWVARVFQNPLLGTAPDLSILDNFRLAALRTTSKKLVIGSSEKFRQQVRDKIATLGMGLENKTGQLMGTLSGGQRQALTLLMSVMDDLKILLLDEPTAALDPRSAAVVMQTADKLIREYQLTALLVTHNLKEAFQYGNRIIHMHDGSVIRDVPSAEKQQLRDTDLYQWFQ